MAYEGRNDDEDVGEGMGRFNGELEEGGYDKRMKSDEVDAQDDCDEDGYDGEIGT